MKVDDRHMNQTNKKKKTPVPQIIAFLIFLFISIAGGYAIGRSLDGLSARLMGLPYPLVLVTLLIFLFAALSAQLILHEAGHLVCGLISGYRFSSFRVGSLMLFKEGKHLRLKTLSIAGTGGQCLMIPPQCNGESIPFTLYLLGGVLMNFISSILFALLYLAIPSSSVFSLLLGALALAGLGVGLMNAIPLHLAMLDNDGYTARLLKKDPQAVLAFYQMMQIHGQIAAGLRLRDMPEEWFITPPEGNTENTLVATIEVYRCNRLLDEGKMDQAADCIRALLASGTAIAGIHRNLLICDLAYCALIADKPDEATQLLDEQQLKFMKSMKSFPSVLRTQYAVAILRDHNASDAATVQTKFDRVSERYPYASDIASEQELMYAVRKKGSAI